MNELDDQSFKSWTTLLKSYITSVLKDHLVQAQHFLMLVCFSVCALGKLCIRGSGNGFSCNAFSGNSFCQNCRWICTRHAELPENWKEAETLSLHYFCRGGKCGRQHIFHNKPWRTNKTTKTKIKRDMDVAVPKKAFRDAVVLQTRPPWPRICENMHMLWQYNNSQWVTVCESHATCTDGVRQKMPIRKKKALKEPKCMTGELHRKELTQKQKKKTRNCTWEDNCLGNLEESTMQKSFSDKLCTFCCIAKIHPSKSPSVAWWTMQNSSSQKNSSCWHCQALWLRATKLGMMNHVHLIVWGDVPFVPLRRHCPRKRVKFFVPATACTSALMVL